MLNETFYLDGQDARTFGVRLQSPIQFSSPVPVYDVESIPGRNGELIYETGAYENRTGSASCFALSADSVERTLRSINRFLMIKPGYRRLETSDDLDHFWLAKVENGARMEQRARKLAPFEISFNCKPQRFLKVGEREISIYEPGIIHNQYGFPSLPRITVLSSGIGGSGTLTVNDTTVEINSIDRLLYLDSDTQNAYNNEGNQNRNIKAPEFPVLVDGENQITWTGDIIGVQILPRWWEL